MSEEFLEELEVLRSIYADALTVENLENSSQARLTYRDEGLFAATFIVPVNYPAQIPVCSICFDTKVTQVRKAAIKAVVEEVISLGQHQVVLYDAIEKIRDLLIEDDPNPPKKDEELEEGVREEEEEDGVSPLNPNESTIRDITASPPSLLVVPSIDVIHGPVTIENQSQFQAHLSTVSSMEDVFRFRESILCDRKVARATHNVFAYRYTCSTTGTLVVHHDCDDDGETAAASRVAEMIRLMNISPGVAVIVTRWYGGIKLGPDRFKFICNSARRLIEDCGKFKIKNSSNGNRKKNNTESIRSQH